MANEPMGSLFAPPYIPGNPQAMAALDAWNAQNRPLRNVDLETLRMPNEEEPRQQVAMMGGSNVYGEGRVPPRQTYRETRGSLSPDVLRAAAMGSPYNIEARRNAIAERVARNERQKAEAERQQQGQMLTGNINPAALAGYGNPYAAGASMGQGIGTQLAGAGVPMLPPPQRGMPY